MAQRKVEIPVEVKDNSDAGIKSATEKLKAMAGGLKSFGMTAKEFGLVGDNSIIGILKGAGVAAGVGLIAGAFRSAAEAAKEWAAGTISGTDALLKAAEGIPLLGQIATGARAAAEAFGAWGDSISSANKGWREAARLQDEFKKDAASRNASTEKTASVFESAARGDARRGLSDPEKLRQDARLAWIDATKQIDLFQHEIDLEGQKLDALNRKFGGKSGPEQEAISREGKLVGAHIATLRSQQDQLKQFRDAARHDANDKADELQQQADTVQAQGYLALKYGATRRFGDLKDNLKSIGDTIKNEWKQTWKDIQDRQDEAELTAFRDAAEAQRDAEEALMPADALSRKREKERFLKIAADDRVDVSTRRGAKDRADALDVVKPDDRRSPLFESRFLHGRPGGSENAAAEVTAKNTTSITTILEGLPETFAKALGDVLRVQPQQQPFLTLPDF